MRPIDADAIRKRLIDRQITDAFFNPVQRQEIGCIVGMVDEAPTIDAVPVVRCKDCVWAKPYERNDGLVGYYCQHRGHTFQYGTNWERLFEPIKEADDFCSYGERKYND